MTDAIAPPTLGLPRINDPAPPFTASSTQGDLSLSDFKGRWGLHARAHDRDRRLRRAAGEFEAMHTQLLALSVDSVYRQIAWPRTIEERFQVRVPFPVIADLGTQVARRYGMIHPASSQAATVRALFVIDPQQNVRALAFYPLTTGRVVAEVKRLVKALQAAAENGVLTPEGRQPGDPCILPAPVTQAEAAKRVAHLSRTP